MKHLLLTLLIITLAAACSHTPKKPSGKAFPINPTYQASEYKMNLFRKKNSAPATVAADKPKRPKTPHQQGTAFIQAAKAFEKSEIDMVRKQSKIAWSIAGVAVLMAAAAVILPKNN